MKINVQLTTEDYIAARRLSLRPRPVLKYVGYLTLIALTIFLIWQSLEAFQTKKVDQSYWITLGITTYILLLYFFIMPLRTKRLFKQHKALQTPLELEFSDTHFSGTSQNGSFNMVWEDFHKWKRNKKMILIYQSSALMHMVPLRFFDSESDIEHLISILSSKLGKEKA